MTQWICLPLSMMGRISMIKMVILQRLLHLFLNIPLRLHTTFFSHLNQTLALLMWAGKQSRIRWEILQRPMHRGGQAIPNVVILYGSASTVCALLGGTPQPTLMHACMERSVTRTGSLLAQITMRPGHCGTMWMWWD